MKCEIANDLLTLYVEDLCSPEARKEVEAHLGECPECSKKLEHYRKEIKNEVSNIGEAYGEKKDAVSERAEIEPMKKVKKKMKRSKWKIAVLSIVLGCVLLVIGALCVGEATNLYPGFTVISDVIKVKAACEDLTKGDTQKFMDLMAMRLEDQYMVRATGDFKEVEDYLACVEENINKGYEHYFKGKDIKVKISGLYSNPYSQMISADESEVYMLVRFMDGDDVVYEMDFVKAAHNKYIISENLDNNLGFGVNDVTFTSSLVPYDDILLKIQFPYAAQNCYRKLISGEANSMGGGLRLGIKKDGADSVAFDEQIENNMQQLMEKGCYVKQVNYSVYDFDAERDKWIYKLWITYEDQKTGDVFVTEQKFIHFNMKMYVIEGEEAVVITKKSGEELTEFEKLAVNMFK